MKEQIMWKKVMTAVVCGGVAVACGMGCNKSDSEGAKKPASKTPAPAVTVTPSTPASKVPSAPAVDPSSTLVDVGGTKLTVGEADKQIKAMIGANADKMNPSQMDALMGRFRSQAAERFVIRTLLTQEVAKRKVQITDKDVDESLAMIKTRLPADMTMDDVLKREGMTMVQLRSNLTEEIRIKTLVESEIPTNAPVADADVAKFYEDQKASFVQPEQVEARHILVKFDATDTDKVKAEKKAKIEKLHKQLVDGADFAKLAKENSDCPSKERGGDLGSFPRGQMVKAFEDAAFSQATNAIGPVIETQFGYHIIQVTGHETGKTNTLAEVKDKLTAHLRQKKQMEMFETFIAKLKTQTKVTYSDLAKQQAPEMPMQGDGE